MEMDRLVVTRQFGSDHRYLGDISTQDLSHRLFDHLYFLSTKDNTNLVSCNRLLCFYSYCSTTDGRVVLYNPTTRRLKFLPPAKQLPNLFKYIFNSCGFGYDPASNDYKVIRNYDLIQVDENGSYRNSVTKFQLYSLATDSWNEIPAPTPNFTLGTRHAPVFLNGSCYWTAAFSYTEGVLAFDFSLQKFSSFDLPPMAPDTKLNLVEINTSLCVILYDDIGGKYKSFKIWQWTGEGWMQLFNELIIFDVKIPLGFRDNFLFLEREIDRKFSQVLICDLRTRELRKTDVFDYPYVMRIVSLHETSYVMPNEISTSTYQSQESWNEYWRRCKAVENHA